MAKRTDFPQEKTPEMKTAVRKAAQSKNTGTKQAAGKRSAGRKPAGTSSAKKSASKGDAREDSSVDVDRLGAKVKKIRLEMGLTQNQVAQALHVTPGFICNVENNRTAMSLRVLIFYAHLTGRTLDSIIGLVDSDYEATALDNEILSEIGKLPEDRKKKLLETIRLWAE